jgi:hypothetical protein
VPQPRDPDAVAQLETCCSISVHYDPSDDLVTRCDGTSMRWQVTHDDMKVGATDATCRHAYEYLVRSGCRHPELDRVQR